MIYIYIILYIIYYILYIIYYILYIEYDRILTFSITESVESWSMGLYSLRVWMWGVQCPAPKDMSRLDAEDIDHIILVNFRSSKWRGVPIGDPQSSHAVIFRVTKGGPVPGMMGLPVLRAPGEAERLCAQLAQSGHAKAAATEDSFRFRFCSFLGVKKVEDGRRWKGPCRTLSLGMRKTVLKHAK